MCDCMWAAARRDNGAFVGRIGLYGPPHWPGLELGWALGARFEGEHDLLGKPARCHAHPHAA